MPYKTPEDTEASIRLLLNGLRNQGASPLPEVSPPEFDPAMFSPDAPAFGSDVPGGNALMQQVNPGMPDEFMSTDARNYEANRKQAIRDRNMARMQPRQKPQGRAYGID